MSVDLGFYLNILKALKITLGVSFFALGLGLLLGLIGAMGEQSRSSFGRLFMLWHLLVRGLPELFALFFIYYGGTILLSKIAGHYVNVNAFMSGVLAMGIIFGAYASQIFIAAYKAIPVGEINAAQSLGLNRHQKLAKIILPQLWQHARPGLMNLWLVLLKESSLVSLIGLNDMMNAAHVAASETFKPFTFYLFVGAIYLTLTALSIGVGKFYKHKQQKRFVACYHY